MARLWTETFDAQSTAGWNTTNGTPTFVTANPRRGAASLRCAPATAVATSIAKAAYGADDAAAHVYLRAYVRVNTAPSARTAIMAWADNTSGATSFMCIKMNTNRTLIAGGSSATTGTASAALTIGQWYRVEMEYDDTANSIKAYLDGTLWATVAGDLGGGRYARFGIIQAASGSIDFDDVAVNDTAGASDNGLPGAQPISTSQALGVATETSTAQTVAPPPPPNFTSVADDFADGIVDPVLWSSTYNLPDGVTETGGRARVACALDYNAYATAAAYTLTGSSLHVQVFPAAAGTAVAEAWTQVLIMSGTAGTDLVMEVDAVAGEINMASRTAYYDPAAVRIPYDPVAHAWFRIREDAGTLYWETAPDGTTWTTRRTLATPAWGADADLALQLISHRDAGDPNYAEFDNVNTLPGTGQEAALSPAAETGTGQALARRKTLALGVATETASSRPFSGRRARQLGTVGEAAAAREPGRTRARALPTGSTLSSGRPLGGAKRQTLPGAGTAADAQALAGAKRQALGTAETAETARDLDGSRRNSLAPAASTTGAQPLGLLKNQPAPVAASADAARPVTGKKQQALGTATDSATAQPVAGAKTSALGTAAETSTVPLAGQAKRTALVPAETIAAARPLDLAAGMTPAEETNTARALGRTKTTTQGVAGEVGEARHFSLAKSAVLGGVTETATARPLTGSRRQALATVEEQSLVLGLGGARARHLPTAAEESSALMLDAGSVAALDRAREATTVGPVAGRKTQPLPGAAGVEAALPLTGRKTLLLAPAVEDTAGRELASRARQELAPAVEVSHAQQLLIPGHADTAAEWTTSRPLGRAKRAVLAAGLDATLAVPVTGRKRRALGLATETTAVRAPGSAKRRALGTALATDSAGEIEGSAHVRLGVATETARALIGPAIRLTWAAHRDEALPLAGQRQRPADDLDANTSGPTLTPSTTGPALTPSSSGPHLVASSTGGG
ncbi:hypothetical protein [Streptomyces sp. NPDC004250]|uniref:hypothetical protein n=1 Tax=Streptomyces sp. NPDC004250 TaxID=3364692 RepID=UPI0036A1D0A0